LAWQRDIKSPRAVDIDPDTVAPQVDYKAWDLTEGCGVNVNIQIRRLTPADAVSYREIRLTGLKSNPEAFGSTFEAESAEPLSSFSERLRSSTVFGAFCRTELLGIAGFVVRKGAKEAHKGLLWGMYVRPDARQTGIGRRLVEAVIDFARRHVELIQLSVVRDNEAARRLYAGLGFVEYGVEKNSLKQGGRYYDEILMALDLRTDPDLRTRPEQCPEVARREEEFAK
jgi:ribosomal protein S18 acetylase RimI-like enzyme